MDPQLFDNLIQELTSARDSLLKHGIFLNLQLVDPKNLDHMAALQREWDSFNNEITSSPLLSISNLPSNLLSENQFATLGQLIYSVLIPYEYVRVSVIAKYNASCYYSTLLTPHEFERRVNDIHQFWNNYTLIVDLLLHKNRLAHPNDTSKTNDYWTILQNQEKDLIDFLNLKLPSQLLTKEQMTWKVQYTKEIESFYARAKQEIQKIVQAELPSYYQYQNLQPLNDMDKLNEQITDIISPKSFADPSRQFSEDESVSISEENVTSAAESPVTALNSCFFSDFYQPTSAKESIKSLSRAMSLPFQKNRFFKLELDDSSFKEEPAITTMDLS